MKTPAKYMRVGPEAAIASYQLVGRVPPGLAKYAEEDGSCVLYFREVNAADMEAALNYTDAEGNVVNQGTMVIELTARLTGILPDTLRQLGKDDFINLGERIGDFFMPAEIASPPTTGT